MKNPVQEAWGTCRCVCVWGGGVERGTRTTTRPMITAIPVIALISRIA